MTENKEIIRRNYKISDLDHKNYFLANEARDWSREMDQMRVHLNHLQESEKEMKAEIKKLRKEHCVSF